jgi:Ca-activated chloride channel family protein
VLASAVHTSYSIFDYDKAVHAGQQGKWDQASAQLQSLLIDKSDDPSLVYDLGVASYKMEDYDHAYSYFDVAASSSDAPTLLKERAHFNAGNAALKQKKIDEAISQYERALTLNAENERTQHNLAIAKKMKKQEEQEKQQENNKQKNNQQKDKDQKQNKDQQKNQQNNNQQNKDDQDKDGQDNDDQSGDNGDQKEENQKQDDQRNQKDKSKQDQEQNNEQQKKDDSRDQSDQAKKEEQKQADKQKNKDVGNEKQDKQGEQQSAGGNEKNGDKDSIENVEPWLANILKSREKDDAALNKKMIRATVEKQLVGQHGQNCW